MIHRLYISIVSLVLIFSLTACRDGESKKSTGLLSDVQSLSDTSVSPSGSEWERVVSGLPEAVLSIWSNDQDEVWLCGADSGSSKGPLILRKKGNRWTRYLSGFEGDLWWVFGVGDSRYFVGESGLFLRHQVGTEIFERIETGTQATLYGVWGPSEDVLWLVGGFVSPENGEGVLLKVEDGFVRSVAELPKNVSPTAAFFKVWGSAADNVWVVGEEGHILHYDGLGWSLEKLDEAERLVTVHGSGSENVIAVGGLTQAALFERRETSGWVNSSPAGMAMLQGVFVGADDRAVAAGMLNAVMERQSGEWRVIESPPEFLDWHATWIHPEYGILVAGGNLKSAKAMDQGAVYRYGEGGQSVDVTWDEVVVGSPQGMDVASLPDTSPAHDVDESQPASDADAGGSSSVADSGEISDAEASPSDVASSLGDVLSIKSDIQGQLDSGSEEDVDEEGLPQDPESLSIRLERPLVGGGTEPLYSDIPMEIVQGPQGGIHLEILIDALIPGGESIPLDLTCTTHIDGELVGYVTIMGFPTFLASGGSFKTQVLTVFFKENIATPYVGLSAELGCDVQAAGQESSESFVVFLVDEF